MDKTRPKWATPKSFFDKLDSIYGFTLDVCAEDWSAKCEKYYTEDDNALMQPWAPEICWMNPPFGVGFPIRPWVQKAYRESQLGATVVAILPSSTDAGWFRDFALNKADVIFVRGRVQFIPPKGVSASSNRQPMFLAVYGGANGRIKQT